MKFSKRIGYTTVFILFSFIFAFTQNQDPTLFSVNGTPVKVSEFLYIYGKNNGKEADYSSKSLNDYLDLYKKFKLKVAKAKALRLDTIPELKEELHMYQQQVSNSYIMDKEVTEQLIKEIYERQKKDISVKHVFIQLQPNASPADTLEAYNRAMKAYNDIKNGVPFGKVVQENSDDRTNLNYSGDLGYVTAMLPDGFYEVENTIYSMNIGDVSLPVRSNAGYHILRVDDIRPSRREMEIAQILVKKTLEQPGEPSQKSIAEEAYKALSAGGDWRTLVQKYSNDEATISKDGYIGFVGINQFERDFEDAIFALTIDGEVSKPIESRLGWHIIKRISKREELPFSQAREKIKALLESDSRYQYAKGKVIERIKSQNGFTLFSNNLEKFTAALPAEFTSFSWELSPDLPNLEIFSLGKQLYNSIDLAKNMKTNTQERLLYPNGTPPSQVVPVLLNTYINEKVIEFEQKHLIEVYPEFRNLMREYEEGILLFEITRQEVWDKASTDTSGLKQFYDKNKEKYKWNERAAVNEYTLKSEDESLIKSIYSYAARKPVEKTMKKFNKKQNLLTYQKDYIEKESEEMKNLSWKPGFETPYMIDKSKGITTWKKVEKLLEPSVKSLDESRGYVIADYQDYLEKEWIKALEKEYKVDVNESVLNSLIKK
ncbi:MAG: peptidylprolyl isomerase [Saprospiraceae bacterium]